MAARCDNDSVGGRLYYANMSNHFTISRQLEDLAKPLQTYVDNDPEQEAIGASIAVLDAVVIEAKAFLGTDDPVVASIEDVISPEAIAEGDPIRVADLLIVVTVLKSRVGRPSVAPVAVRRLPEANYPWG